MTETFDSLCSSRRRFGIARCFAGLLAVFFVGCAGLTCTASTIVVAKKEERRRTKSKVVGVQTSGAGTVREVERTVEVREYWVQSGDGAWHRVSEAEFEVAAPGQPLSVCR